MSERGGREVRVRAASSADAASVAWIYNHYVAHTIVTFEEDAVAVTEISRRIETVRASSYPWLVALYDGGVVGYACATRWRSRRAYRFSAEVSAYVAPGRSRRGIGSRLYESLLDELRERGIHAAMGGIALPNEASVAFHERFGFQKVAHFEQVGCKFDRWIDVGYWQRIL